MSTDRFVFTVDKAGRHWIWDTVAEQNWATKAESREEAINQALTLLANCYQHALAERNAAQAIADKIRDIVCPDDEE